MPSYLRPFDYLSRSQRSSGRGRWPNRRHFLICCAAATAAGTYPPAATATDSRGVLLRPGGNNLFRVRTTLEVKGNANVPANPLVSRKSDLKLPISSEAVFDYEERLHRHSESDANSPVLACERFYHEARNQGTLNRTEHQQRIRDSVRETIVRRDLLPEVIYAVDDYFQREELELLRLPFSSAALDALLPTRAVTAGTSYQISAGAIQSVLNLTSVEASEITAEIAEIDPQVARITIQGRVDGSVEGVPTVMRINAKLTFDRSEEACTWLAMAIHETREAGMAEPGFDVAATIKMVRRPLQTVLALPTSPRPIDLSEAIPGDRLYVELNSKELGISMLMGRRWRIMTDVPGAAMMRMIESDRSIAQCDFRPLVALGPQKQWSLEALQAEVHQMLGDQLSDVVEADESLSDTGLRVLRVAAHGQVQSVPIRWVVLHFSDESGRRVLATFTMEGDRIDSFAGSDVQLANTLRFTPLPDRNRDEKRDTQPQNRASAEIAKANSGEKSGDEVQSASDLR